MFKNVHEMSHSKLFILIKVDMMAMKYLMKFYNFILLQNNGPRSQLLEQLLEQQKDLDML